MPGRRGSVVMFEYNGSHCSIISNNTISERTYNSCLICVKSQTLFKLRVPVCPHKIICAEITLNCKRIISHKLIAIYFLVSKNCIAAINGWWGGGCSALLALPGNDIDGRIWPEQANWDPGVGCLRPDWDWVRYENNWDCIYLLQRSMHLWKMMKENI